MKKILLVTIVTTMLFGCQKSNESSEIENLNKPTSIVTEDGIKQITYNGEGNPQITFSLAEFRSISKDAGFIKKNKPKPSTANNDQIATFDEEDEGFDDGDACSLGIRIATRKSNCVRGVGFRCGFVSNLMEVNSTGAITNVTTTSSSNITATNSSNGINLSRVYTAFVKAENNVVTVTFTENVNWNWLQNN